MIKLFHIFLFPKKERDDARDLEPDGYPPYSPKKPSQLSPGRGKSTPSGLKTRHEGPKMIPRGPQKGHEMSQEKPTGVPKGPRTASGRPQDSSKTAPRRAKRAPRCFLFVFFFNVFGSFLFNFWSQLGASLAPKVHRNQCRIDAKMLPRVARVF